MYIYVHCIVCTCTCVYILLCVLSDVAEMVQTDTFSFKVHVYVCKHLIICLSCIIHVYISDCKLCFRWSNGWSVFSSYLHKNDIVHGNLSLASIFIQHNGAVKIGSGTCTCTHILGKYQFENLNMHVKLELTYNMYTCILPCPPLPLSLSLSTHIWKVSPDAIHEHVKTKQLEHRVGLHYTAPEYAGAPNTFNSVHVYVLWKLTL